MANRLFAVFNELSRRRAPGTAGADGLPEGFPTAEWRDREVVNEERWKWFTGTALDEYVPDAVDEKNEPILKYPLQVNPVYLFASVHAAVLAGEIPDGPDPVVPMQVRVRRTIEAKESLVKEAQKIEDHLNDVWRQNAGSALQAEGMLIAQALGGAVYRITFAPESELPGETRIELIYPDYFLPIYRTMNYWDLLEAYMVYQIPAREAVLGYGIPDPGGVEYVLYVEHWLKNRFDVTVDGHDIDIYSGSEKVERGNEFGFVPFVYIPNIRAGSFYGDSIVDDVKGLVLEHNARLADKGDASRDFVNSDFLARNVGAVRKVTLPNGRNLYEIGKQTSPAMGEPDAWPMQAGQYPDSLANLDESLWRTMLRMARVGDVAFGEDEGSQRSALTLAFRMWPVTSRARWARINWTVGLTRIAEYILKIAAKKGLIEGVNLNNWWERFELHPKWAPMIPRDAEQALNELVLGTQAGFVSVPTAVRELNLVKDVDEELEKIEEWTRKKAEMQSFGKPQPGEGSASTDTNEPVANPITE